MLGHQQRTGYSGMLQHQQYILQVEAVYFTHQVAVTLVLVDNRIYIVRLSEV